MASPSEPAGRAAAEVVLDLAWSRPPTLGPGRLVCIDGPAGSGKTTLAAELADLTPDAVVVHMDDLYDGWSGLATVGDQLATLVPPMAAGEPGHYRRYDWHRGAFAEVVRVPATPLLVLEGVGSANARFARLITVLVWVTAARGLRRARWLARDGEDSAPHRDAWMEQEERWFAADGTADRADLVVSSGTPAPATGRGIAGGSCTGPS